MSSGDRLDLHPFSFLWTQIDGLIEPKVTAVYTALFAWVAPLFQLSGLLFLAFTAAAVAVGHYRTIAHDFHPKMLRLLVAAIAVNVSFYGQYIAPLVLHGLPDGILSAIGSANSLPSGSAPAAFDNMFVDAFAVALQVVDGMGVGSLFNPRMIFVGVLAAMYVVAAAFSILGGFLVWAGSDVALYLLIALGPIPLACSAFQATRKWFEQWVATLACAIFLQVAAFTLLAIFVGAIKPLLKMALQAKASSVGSAATADMVVMIIAGCIFAMVCFAMTKLSGWSQAIFGGALIPASKAADALTSAPMEGTKAIAQSVGGMGAASISPSATRRVGGAPGASWSRSNL